jgi:4-amino-4-deoxy-L-arabinose transferase-like glycosyltransferase
MPQRLHLSLLLSVWILFVGSGLVGLDFGNHWDETDFQLFPVKMMLHRGTLLPDLYYVPGVTRWLVALPSLFEGLRDGRAAMVAVFGQANHLLTVRAIFLFVSSLTIVFLWLAVRALGFARWQATAAAALTGLCWELQYHARFIAPDGVLVTCASLTLLLLALFQQRGRARWLWAAAAAAGLGAGTKYQGALLLIPVLLASVLFGREASRAKRVARVPLLGALALLVYLVTTPGTALDAAKWWEQFRFIERHYATGHDGHTVGAWFEHGRLYFQYFLLAQFSPARPIAVLLALAVVVGGWLCIRDDRRRGAVLLGFPLLYLLFTFSYRVLIVRNDLLLLPFFAVFFARALGELVAVAERRHRAAPLALAVVLGAVAVAQGGWLVAAAWSIRTYTADAQVRDAIDHVARHSAQRFLLSPKVRARAEAQGLSIPPNASSEGAADAVAFFARAEGPASTQWAANDPRLTEAVFGPREINFNYYPDWEGADRVVVMRWSKAQASSVPLAR